MTSSPDAFYDPADMAARAQQQHQGWADGGQRPYARGLMSLGRIKSESLYNESINPMRDILKRFNKYRYVEPADVNV